MVRWWLVASLSVSVGCGGRSTSDGAADGMLATQPDVVDPADGDCPDGYLLDQGVSRWTSFEPGDNRCHRSCTSPEDCADRRCNERSTCSDDYCRPGFQACDLADAY